MTQAETVLDSPVAQQIAGAEQETRDVRPISGDHRQVKLSVPVAILGFAVMALVGSIYVPVAPTRLFLMTFGGVLTFAAGLLAVIAMRQRIRQRVIIETVGGMISGVEEPSYIVNDQGTILTRNRAAEHRTDQRKIPTIHAAFADLFAHPEAALGKMQLRAVAKGAAHEDIVTRRGHLRLEVRQISGFAFLWSLVTLSERAGGDRATNAISLPMMTVGPTGTILFMNDAIRRMTGGRAKVLEDVFRDLPLVSGTIHQVDAASGVVDCLVAQVPSSGGRSEVYLLPGDRTTISARGEGAWQAIEDLPVPLLKLSLTGDVLASNREARTLLPMPIGPGTRLSDMLEGLGRPLIDWLDDAAHGRAANHAEFLRGAGTYQDTFVQVTLSLSGTPDNRHLIAALNDATELKTLEANFVQSQKMQAIGQLAGGVAHDFNNLLTAISGHCDLLLLRHDPSDPDYGDLIQIHQNSNRAASLVGQLLAFSRKQNLMPEVVDLRDTLADLTHLLNRLVGEKVTLRLNHDPLLMNIRADKRQLEQVLMNLVVNARDAMPEGGEIRIDTETIVLAEPLERDRATVPAGTYSVVHVVDEGCGISTDKMRMIFEPFYSDKRPGEGTGLGLSTAYGIVKQTGGYIFVDSTVNEGSRFSLYFPGYDAPAAPSEPVTTASEVLSQAPADGVVLLVEDEAPVRAFASRALRMRGYDVLEADSAEAALELLDDDRLIIDIFVTDVIMPGKDGPTWVREALKGRPTTKVVFVSGYAEDSFTEHQAMIPNSVFLPKPFSLTELTSTVQQQLN